MGVRIPLPAESAPFCRSVQFSNQNFPQKTHLFIAQNKNFPQKRHSFIAQNKKFSPEKKMLFFATRNDVESYSQMPEKRILALEFSNFSGGGSELRGTR
jgi:hypothetical protein